MMLAIPIKQFVQPIFNIVRGVKGLIELFSKLPFGLIPTWVLSTVLGGDSQGMSMTVWYFWLLKNWGHLGMTRARRWVDTTNCCWKLKLQTCKVTFHHKVFCILEENKRQSVSKHPFWCCTLHFLVGWVVTSPDLVWERKTWRYMRLQQFHSDFIQ